MQNASRWERVAGTFDEADRLYSKPRSFASDVWFRFRHKPTALVGLVIIALLILFEIGRAHV